MVAGQHLKVGGLELEDDGATGESSVRQSAGDAIAERTKRICQLPGMAQIACERNLRRDALRRPISDDLAVVLAAREPGQLPAELAEAGDELRLRDCAQRRDRRDADRFQLARGRRADAEHLANRQRSEKVHRLGVADDRKAARLVEIRGELGEELVEAEADRDGDADVTFDRERNAGQQHRRRPVRQTDIRRDRDRPRRARPAR